MARKMQYTAAVAALFSSSAIASMFVMYTPGGDDTSIQRIDPIISPGGISGHVHHVFGADKLTPTLDYEALQSSKCTTVGSADGQGNEADHSIYWHPALYMESNDGSGYVRVPTNGHKMYYLDVGEGQKQEPFEFPPGFRMIAGDPFARSSTGNNAIQWKCYNGGAGEFNGGQDGGFPTGVSTCSSYPYFFNSVEFPHCWSGQDYDPSNPSAHMAYPTGGDPRAGSCPSSHPIRLPHLFIENLFNIDEVAGKVTPDSFVLAQGDATGYGMHQDFFNGWEAGAIPNLFSTCPEMNFDVGECSNFQPTQIGADSCSLPVQYKENVDTPGKFLPGCNPISKTNPAPQMAIAALGVSTDQCKAGNNHGGNSTPSPSAYAPPSGSGAPGQSSAPSQSSAAPVASSEPSTSAPPPADGSYQDPSSSAANSLIIPTTAVVTTFVTALWTYSPSTQDAGSSSVSSQTKHRHGYHARPTWGS